MTHQKLDEKLTKWEVGNVLVRLSDDISMAQNELREFQDLVDLLESMRGKLRAKFNQDEFDKEMGFGI